MNRALKTLVAATVLLAALRAAPALGDTPRERDAEATASALVADAARAYDQNQLDEALRLLARAYELSPRPSILYNQAQVLRTKNDCAAALDAYQRFIVTTIPDDANRERAEQRRAEMQACVDRAKPDGASPVVPVADEAASAKPAAAPDPAQLAIAERAPPAASPATAVGAQITTGPSADPARGRHRTTRIAGWGLVGVGVVAAGAAAVLSWQAHGIQEDLNNSDTWRHDSQSREDEGRRDATWARWCAAAAAVAGGGGAALLVISRPTAASGSAAAPRPSSALIGWSGTF